ncbi:MAG: DUF934 domain-containing protein [Methylococcales bacterium]|nr:DUF934 domain-containing protein [Methylococcales bacterium]
MQIIKDKKIIDDTWSYIADDAELKKGDITVSLARWKKDKQQLLASGAKVGVRINSDDSIEEIAEDLERIQLIELDFPAFADGRLFSYAWLLRSRYNYQGEIRATGRYMPDQVYYLSRVGVNAFYPEKVEHLPVVLSHLNDFTVNYQRSVN